MSNERKRRTIHRSATALALCVLAAQGAWGQATDLECNRCVDTSDLAADAVTSGKIADGEVTSPVTNLGAWIFAGGIGVLVVLIRVWGGLPEGVMYAILLMNALTPFINRATQPRVFGHEPKKVKEAQA